MYCSNRCGIDIWKILLLGLFLAVTIIASAPSFSAEPAPAAKHTEPALSETATPNAATASPAVTTSPTTPASPSLPSPSSSPAPAAPPLSPSLSLEQLYHGDATAGQAKSAVCAACHGPDGNSTVLMWPKIAGQGKEYLVKELIEYRKGQQGPRFDPNMFAMTQALSDQDIADLAAYFADQTMSPGSAKADLVALGQKIYRGGNPDTGVPACAACHGAKGEGNELARFPKLSGQHADYTLDQLKKFKAKTRTDDPNQIMEDIGQRMSEDEMKAVSSYISGLH